MEEKAKKVLPMMAKVNCKPILPGRPVSVEAKRQLFLQKTGALLHSGIQSPCNALAKETKLMLGTKC